MSASLYSLNILRLAAESATTSRLADPANSVERRASPCGSRIIVDLRLDALGQVADYGHAVHACAMGQAAAALVARHVRGRSRGEIAAMRDAVRDYLSGLTDVLPAEFDPIASARPHPARHGAVLLPFEAVVEALR